MEIRKLQRSTDLLLRMLPFQRLVREVATNYTSEPFRFTAEALLALQEASEDMLVRHTRASACCLLGCKQQRCVPLFAPWLELMHGHPKASSTRPRNGGGRLSLCC